MDTIQKLIEQFRQFPGIGPRQAKRFVYFLLAQPQSVREELSRLTLELGRHIRVCASCYRFFPLGAKTTTECTICSDPNRQTETLLVVSRDVDFENIEKSKSHSGTYFILGGSVPILEKNPEGRIRAKELQSLIEKRMKGPKPLNEIVIALNATPEGENTQYFLESLLQPLASQYNLKISTLGRGLSTGLELEYSDSETIKSALKNRQ